jgi:hypothetical protein
MTLGYIAEMASHEPGCRDGLLEGVDAGEVTTVVAVCPRFRDETAGAADVQDTARTRRCRWPASHLLLSTLN